MLSDLCIQTQSFVVPLVVQYGSKRKYPTVWTACESTSEMLAEHSGCKPAHNMPPLADQLLTFQEAKNAASCSRISGLVSTRVSEPHEEHWCRSCSHSTKECCLNLRLWNPHFLCFPWIFCPTRFDLFQSSHPHAWTSSIRPKDLQCAWTSSIRAVQVRMFGDRRISLEMNSLSLTRSLSWALTHGHL